MKGFEWVLCLLLASGPALAGTEITIETRELGAAPDAKAQRTVLEIEGRKLHAEAGNGRHGVIWSGEEGVLQILDHVEKSIFRIDRATARQVASARDGIRAGGEALPDVARGALESWLGSEPPGRLELRSSGGSAQVSGFTCRLLEVLRNGERLAEVCEGPAGTAGVTPQALAPARELAKFAAELGDLLPRSMSGDALDALMLIERVQGVPLRVRAWPKGALATESQIVKAVPRHFGLDRFQPPPDYAASLGLPVGP